MDYEEKELCVMSSSRKVNGCLPFTKKFPTFRLERKWKGYYDVSCPENFQIFRDVLKGVPKFPTKIPNRKCVYHLRFSPVQTYTPILMRIRCHFLGVVQMVHGNPDRNFSLESFAYHLYKPSTNWFSDVNGKQPISIE